MKQYVDLCKTVLENGEIRKDRTGTGTISLFGYQFRCNLQDGFPLLTTKKVFFRGIAEELIWIINGNTNIKPLVDKNVKIWNDWPYEKFKHSNDYNNETMDEFINKIKESNINDEFVQMYGDLGPVYGKQWRNFNDEGIDQLKELIEGIKNNPFSRRHIICAWNPAQIDKMALPPCHAFIQFYVSSDGKKLSCQLYQRSADIFLGVPFNIASYALLTHMIAQVCNLEVGDFIHTFGDSHIYLNHIDIVKTQIERVPLPLCKLELNPNIKNIEDFTIDDIKIINYKSHGKLVGKVSV